MDWHLVHQFKDCIVTIKIWNRKQSVEFALITLVQITRQKDWNLIEHQHSVESIISPPRRTEIGSVVTACIFPQCEKTVFSSCDREQWFMILTFELDPGTFEMNRHSKYSGQGCLVQKLLSGHRGTDTDTPDLLLYPYQMCLTFMTLLLAFDC